MTNTRTLKEKPFNPFRQVKHLVHTGNTKGTHKSWRIAYALRRIRVVTTSQTKRTKLTNAIHMVENRYKGFDSAADWIREYMAKNNQPEPTQKQIQKWRHLWLDHLANEWDKGVRK